MTVHIAVFLILADPVDVKKADQQCETVSQPSIQPDKVDWPMGSCPSPCLAFDLIRQNWEDSSTVIARLCNGVAHFVALVRIYRRLANLV